MLTRRLVAFANQNQGEPEPEPLELLPDPLVEPEPVEPLPFMSEPLDPEVLPELS